MELAAILMVDAHPRDLQGSGSDQPLNVAAESFAEVPLALLDVLGRSVVQHVTERLRRAGVEAVTALTPGLSYEEPVLRDGHSENACQAAADVWRAAEEAFSAYAGEGAENVLFLRLGPYAEFDVGNLLRFHLERRQNATLLHDGKAALDAAVVVSARRGDAAFLLQKRLRATRAPTEPFACCGYVNRLQSAHDLRRLAQDALLMRCEIRPAAQEIKPGVWVGERARIHRTARVLAPAYIGAHAKLRAASVVTRCAVVEHHSEVDCGTVLEDTTVLPYTYVGTGLDASHTVIGFGKIAHLRRQTEVEIADSRLVGSVTTSASWRTLKNAASLAAYLPKQAVRGLVSGGRRTQPQAEPDLSPGGSRPADLEPPPEPVSASNQTPQFAADFVAVRRYGNE